MISFISKKVIAIYRASNFFFFIVLCLRCLGANAGTDLNSYCFQSSVNLNEVKKSLGFLLLPTDVVNLRDEDNCIDITASSDRGNLFEKFLAKRYNLKRDFKENSSCRLDLKTTIKKQQEANTIKIGERNVLSKTESSGSSVSSMELLLGEGIPGEIEAGTEKLKVTCRLIGNENANLIFSYVDKNKASVSTEASLKKGEWLNIASVIKELDDKNKTMGIPQTEISNTVGKTETIYELQFK